MVPEGLQRVAIAFADDPVPVAGEIARGVFAAMPELAADGDEQAFEEVRRSIEANVALFLRLLAERREVEPGIVPQQGLDHARSAVRRGVSLAAILRAYRLTHELGWERLSEVVCETVPTDDVRPLLDVASRFLFRHMDVICNRIVEEYDAERARWVRSAAASRIDAVRAILDGKAVDLDAAGRTLGYELRRHHVGFVLWRDSDAGGLAGLEEAASVFASTAGFQQPLLLAVGTLVWGWMGTQCRRLHCRRSRS